MEVQMARRILFGLALFCTLSARPATAQTPVPSTTFSMTGTHTTNDLVTVTYRAFQNPGDPYRVVCSEPCTADLNAIYGLYAGFAPVYQQIVALFGVAPTANVVPFDMHIDADHWCGPEQPGVGGIGTRTRTLRRRCRSTSPHPEADRRSRIRATTRSMRSGTAS